MRRVLVAVDGSEVSEQVGEFVNSFFGPLDVEVLAVYVGGLPVVPAMAVPAAWGGVYPWGFPYTASSSELAGAMAGDLDGDGDGDRRRAEAAARAAGIDDEEPIVESGDPATAIVRAADEVDADLIVVGSGDRSLIDRLFAPSVSLGVVKKADRPVLVVKA